MTPDEFKLIEDKIDRLLSAVAHMYENMPLEDPDGKKASEKFHVIDSLRKSSDPVN